MRRRSALVCLSLALCSAIAATAFAADISRDEYKAQVEPICEKNRQTLDRYLSGIRKLVKAGKLKKAGQNFSRAALALEEAQKQLSAVERPPADIAKLRMWLHGIEREVAQMRAIAVMLKAGKASSASSLSVRLIHDATTANNQVVVFGFNYCRIDPSRYT
jgi:hypothetical protein